VCGDDNADLVPNEHADNNYNDHANLEPDHIPDEYRVIVGHYDSNNLPNPVSDYDCHHVDHNLGHFNGHKHVFDNSDGDDDRNYDQGAGSTHNRHHTHACGTTPCRLVRSQNQFCSHECVGLRLRTFFSRAVHGAGSTAA